MRLILIRPFTLSAMLIAATVVSNAQDKLVPTGMQRYYEPIKRNLEGAADAMPADKYDYKLTPDQMSFGEWMVHSAQRNYADCAVLKGESAPEAARQLASLKGKDAIAKALKDSFAYCSSALSGIDDQKVLATPQTANAFLHILIHNNEIYGNVVGYLRSSGIVPPSTAARANQKGKN